jgi:predicted glutamine amidotransferase
MTCAAEVCRFPGVCRLFGLTGGPLRLSATFWLLEAPDSLAVQSRREPDGTGLGVFGEEGAAHVIRQPIAAYADEAFAREAREVRSHTFLAHIRFASTGGLAVRNTHPFLQQGRLLAHNGVIGGLDALDERLGPARALVRGETDSERFFALVTTETQARGGDVTAGLTAAARWVAANLPLYALNVIVISAHELWALRYPETHDLLVLERGPGGVNGRHLEHASAAGRVRVRSGDLAKAPCVAVASEAMDEDPGWRSLEPGELLHVDAGLRVRRESILPGAPAHPLTLDDLHGHAAKSQTGR